MLAIVLARMSPTVFENFPRKNFSFQQQKKSFPQNSVGDAKLSSFTTLCFSVAPYLKKMNGYLKKQCFNILCIKNNISENSLKKIYRVCYYLKKIIFTCISAQKIVLVEILHIVCKLFQIL